MRRILFVLLILAVVGTAVFLLDPPSDSEGGSAPALRDATERPSPSRAEAALPSVPEGRADPNTTLIRSEGTPFPEDDGAEDLLALHVLVVDPFGTPLPDVPVALAEISEDAVDEVTRASSDLDGLLTLRFDPATATPETELRVGFPFHVQDATPEAVTDPLMWGEEPLPMVLPVHGSAEVHLFDLNGKPWLRPTPVKLAGTAEEGLQGQPPIFRHTVANLGVMSVDGVAVFPFVGMYKRVRTAQGYDPWARWKFASAEGPRVAGERIRVDMHMQRRNPVIRVTLRNPDGSSLRHRNLDLHWKTRTASSISMNTSSFSFAPRMTDGEGKLEFPVERGIYGEIIDLTLTTESMEGIDPLSTTVAMPNPMPIPWAEDETWFDVDLGVVQMDAMELVGSGSVRDAEGNPVQAEFSLNQYRDLKIGEFEKVVFEDPPALRIVQGEAGDFQCYAIAHSDRFELEVRPAGGLIEARDFHRGADDLHFVVEPESFVRGRLAIPEGFLAEDFRIRFYTGDAMIHPNQFVPTPDAIPNEDGSFRLRALEAGQIGTVGVIYEPSRALIVAIEGIEPTQDEGLDEPRLHPIDLAGLTHATIKVTSPHAIHIGSIHYKVLSPESGVNPMEIYVWSDEFGITSLHPEVEIWMEVHDHAREYLTVTSGHHEVELSQARRVLLELDAPPLKEGYSWRSRTRQVDQARFEGDTHFFPGSWENGVKVPVKLTGDHILHLQLVKGDRSSVSLPEWKVEFPVPTTGPIGKIGIQVTEVQLLDAYQKLDLPPRHH